MTQEEAVRQSEEPEEPEEHEFASVYANVSRFETSAWDLKIFFGQLMQHTSKGYVDWHTAVTMPWTQAKIFSYFLLANLAFHERINGPMAIPATIKPPKPERPSAEMIDKEPGVQEAYEILAQLHSQMFG